MTKLILTIILAWFLVLPACCSVSFSINMYDDIEIFSQSINMDDGQFDGCYLMNPFDEWGEPFMAKSALRAEGRASESINFHGIYDYGMDASMERGEMSIYNRITTYTIFSVVDYHGNELVGG